MPTKIQWCDETINPLQDVIKGKSGRGYHCTKIRDGCKNCYAEVINKRFGNGLPFDNTKHEFELVQKELGKPFKWKKPIKIFVQSMGDVFHEEVPDEFRDKVFAMMALNPQHTFIILTKRPKIACKYLTNDKDFDSAANLLYDKYIKSLSEPLFLMGEIMLPINNLWLGVSVSTQKDADEMIPILLQIPASKRIVSVEPQLENISINAYLQRIDGIFCGCESGQNRRHVDIDCIRNLRDQCNFAGIPFFLKQMEINGKVVHMPELGGLT